MKHAPSFSASLRVARPLVLVTALGGLAGCDPVKLSHSDRAEIEANAKSLAEAYCSVYASCECPEYTDPAYDDLAHCVSQESVRIARSFEQAADNGLVFNPACLDQLTTTYQRLGCMSAGPAFAEFGKLSLEENLGCALYHGDETEGICEPVAGTPWSDCAGDRWCINSSCLDRPRLARAGESCSEWSDPYDTTCSPGSFCDLDDSGDRGSCQPSAGVGEACSTWGASTEFLYCTAALYCHYDEEDGADSGTCTPLGSIGDPCRPTDGVSCDGDCYSETGSDGECVYSPRLCWDSRIQPPVQPE